MPVSPPRDLEAQRNQRHGYAAAPNWIGMAADVDDVQ